MAAGRRGGPEVGAAETVDAWREVVSFSKGWGVSIVADGLGVTTGNEEGDGVGGPKELGELVGTGEVSNWGDSLTVGVVEWSKSDELGGVGSIPESGLVEGEEIGASAGCEEGGSILELWGLIRENGEAGGE